MFLSDIAFTFYKPISVINRYAESNKWGDALRANCVILVNEEVETAGYLLKEKVAISCPYLDADALKNIVLDFANNKEALHTFKKNVAEYVKRMPTFEEQIHDLIVESNEKN